MYGNKEGRDIKDGQHLPLFSGSAEKVDCFNRGHLPFGCLGEDEMLLSSMAWETGGFFRTYAITATS